MAEVVAALEGDIAPIECITADADGALDLRPRGRRAVPDQASMDPRPGVHRPHPERDDAGRPSPALEEEGSRYRMTLEIQNLHVRTEDREILHGVDLTVKRGETHALMGPNGSGKSTLANTLMGNPNYEVTEGRIVFNGEDITEADPDERARAGLFLAFQYPATIPGVSVANFLRMAVNAGREEPIKVKEFGSPAARERRPAQDRRDFTKRYLNEGFSGGEKKRAEILQLAMLQPDFAVLDETDSGLDIDALRIVSEGVNAMRSDERGFLIITHYTRILELRAARLRAHHARRPDRPRRRRRAGRRARGEGLRVHPRGGGAAECRARRHRRRTAARRPSRSTRRSRSRPGGAPASGRPACAVSTSTRSSRSATTPGLPPSSTSATTSTPALIVQHGANVVHTRRLPTSSLIVMPLEQAVEEHGGARERVLRQAPPPRRGQVRGGHRCVLDRRRVRPRARRTSQIEEPIQIV